MATTLGTLLIDVKSDTTQLVQGFNRAESVVNKTTKSMGNAIKALAGAYLSLSAVDLARSYAKQVDAVTTVNNRLKLVTKSTQELTTAQNELFKIAQQTSLSYTSTVDLYGRVARSTKDLGLSQKELLGITDSINKAMIISGGTAESMNAALVQLGQAFSADFKAVGQELSSIREQTPRLYESMVKGMGVTSGQFKKLAEDGQLSSEKIINALKSQVIVLNEEYGKFTKTIEQSFVNLSNASQKVINDFDTLTGISKTVSENILSLSSAIDNLSPEEISNLVEYVKNATIAIGASYVAIKSLKVVYGGLNYVVENFNKTEGVNIALQKAKEKAILATEKAEKARLAVELASTRNGGILLVQDAKKITQLETKAKKLEESAIKANALTQSLETTSKSLSLTSIGATALRTALMTIPFVAISTGITLIATALSSASRNAEILSDALNAPIEKLQKLTENQLKNTVRVLNEEIDSQLKVIQNRLEAVNQDLSTASRFADTKKIQEQNLSAYDDEVQKLNEIIQKRDEILSLTNKQSTAQKETIAPNKFDTTSIDEMVKKTLNPYQSALDDINKKWKEQFDILTKNGQDTSGVVQAWTAEIKKLDEDTAKANNKLDKENQKSLENRQNQYANYYEKVKDFSNLWQIEEQKIRQENTALTVNELNKLLEVEKANFNERFLLQKDILNVEDWKNYYYKIGEFEYAWQIELSENFDKWKALAGEKLPELVEMYKTEFFDKVNSEKLKPFEFDIDLDNFETPITNTMKAFDKLNKSTKEYQKYIKQTGLTKEQIADADEKNFSNQLKGYSNIAGAISELSGLNQREMAGLQIAQTSLALAEGTRAILTQGTGDPYTAIPRMVAMGAMVGSLLSNIGVAFGGSGKTTTINTTAPVNTGAGTVLGDPTAVSEAITKSLEILEDFAEPQFQTLVSMNKYLANISNALSGVSSLLIRQGGFAFGEGFTPFSETKQNIKINETLVNAIVGGGVGLILSKLKIPIISDIAGMFGGLVNKVLGSVFGKTSVSTTMTDSGIYFANQLLTNAIDSFSGSAYQTIQTTISKKSLFKKSSSTTVTDYFQALDNETSRQFSLVLRNLYDTTILAGEALDSTASETSKSLENFVVSIGKISLLGKTGQQIQETLTAVFGKVGDQIATTAFPALIPFQKVGEALFTTMTRVAKGMEEAEFYIGRLGNRFEDLKYTEIINKQGDVGFEALFQSIQKVEQATYPTNNGLLEIIENLNSTTEELYSAYTTLDELRDRLIFLGQTAQGLSSSMIYGAGSVEALQGGFNSFFENFLTSEEQLAFNTQQLIKSFDDIGVAIPSSKDSFRALLSSLDLTTESGQELYGRLITLSESFSDVYTEVEKVNSVFIEFYASLKNIATDFINSFNTTGLSDTRAKILKYNELRSEFESLFDVTGVLKTGTDINKASSIYSQLSSIGKTLGNENQYLVRELVGQFEQDINRFDFATDVMKVSIVDGLGGLETLSKAQIQQLQTLTSEQIAQLQLGSLPNTTNISYNSPVSNSNFSGIEGLKGIISEIFKNISDYPKRTYEILDDVIYGNARMKVEMQ